MKSLILVAYLIKIGGIVLKNKKTLLIFILIFAVLGIGIFGFSINSVKKSQKENLVKIYIMAIENVIDSVDENLSQKEYIALNSDTLKGLNKNKKKEVLAYLEKKYDIEVIDASYEKLLNMGKIIKGEEPTGMIVYIEDVKNYITTMKIHIGLEWASLGGKGLVVEVNYDKGEWKVIKTTTSWIS